MKRKQKEEQGQEWEKNVNLASKTKKRFQQQKIERGLDMIEDRTRFNIDSEIMLRLKKLILCHRDIS